MSRRARTAGAVLLASLAAGCDGEPGYFEWSIATAPAAPFVEARSLATMQGKAQVTPTDLAAADVDGDGLLDLIVSAGYDLDSPRPVGVYFNQGSVATSFAPFSNDAGAVWWSSTKRNYLAVCAADVDGDGCVDMVAAHLSQPGGPLGQLFDYYPNSVGSGKACTGFTPDPAQALTVPLPVSVSDGYAAMATACEFADADGDGDYDLGFSASAGPSSDEKPSEQSIGFVGVFENERGKLQRVSWITNTAIDQPHPEQAMDMKFADLNLDGRLDVAASMMGLHFYLGQTEGFSTAPDATWNVDSRGFSNKLAVAWSEEVQAIVVGLADNNWLDRAPEYGFNRVLQVCAAGICEVWKSPTTGKGSAIDLRDLSAAGKLDVIAARYGNICGRPGSADDGAKIYWSPLRGGTDETPLNRSANASITAQSILTWSFSGAAERRTLTAIVPAGQQVATFRGPDAPALVMTVDAVEAQDGTRLGFTFTPGNSWLSLDDRPAAAVTIKVSYTTADRPDLFIADSCGYVRAFRNR